MHDSDLNTSSEFARAFQSMHDKLVVQQQDELHQRIKTSEGLINSGEKSVDLYIQLIRDYCSLNQYELAISTSQRALTVFPKNSHLYLLKLDLLNKSGSTDEAIQLLEHAEQQVGNNLALVIRNKLFLPNFYATDEQLSFFRNRYIKGLEALSCLVKKVDAKAFFKAITANFYLAYQQKNDINLQKKYGQVIHQAALHAYPLWMKSKPMLKIQPGEKIRVGYISANLNNHTVSVMFLNWLKHANENDFQIFTYYTGQHHTAMTTQVNKHSDVFHQLGNDLETVAQQVASDKLHILVYLDIGMSDITTRLAALRLSPVQCAAWGHPVTTGLENVDYYLSPESMEPEQAQRHYSERLVPLPNLGIAYSQPLIPVPALIKKRNDFGLGKQSVVYMCSQNLLKYLPEHDSVFARIATQVKSAQFVFFAHNSMLKNRFLTRLKRSFEGHQLDAEKYCLILPFQSTVDFWNIHLLADIFLDPIGWTGGRTTLEAISLDLPIVTCKGQFMRQRQSCAVLTMIGVTETIAQDRSQYIQIAIRLAMDAHWRKSITQKIHNNRKGLLYDDLSSIRGLEKFYRRAVESVPINKLANAK